MNDKKRTGVRPRSTSPEPPQVLHRQKKESENAWQYPSTRRCLACGQLGCTTCGGKIDPEQKKMRLETLKLNTPYERQKLKRLNDELLQEEAQARRVLLDEWETSRDHVLLRMRTDSQLLRAVKKERKTRLFLSKQESAERELLVALLDLQTVQVHLLEAESKGRHAVVAQERAMRQTFSSQVESVEKFANIVRREQCTRDTILFNECALWNKLLTAEADNKSAMVTQHKEQNALLSQYLAKRGDIEGCWRSGLSQLRDGASAHVRWINDLMQERIALYAKRESKANELFADALRTYHRMRTERREVEEFIEEQRFLLDRKLEGIAREEQFARQGVVDDHTSGMHRLFQAMKSSEEDVYKAERYKVSQQEGEISRALSFLIGICSEEDEAFNELIALEARERGQRALWIVSRREQRDTLLAEWEASVKGLAEEEKTAWNLILRQMEEDEMQILATAASRDRMARELYSGFVLGLQELSAAERDARFHIISLMSEEEEVIHKWKRLREQQRLDMSAAETHERDALTFAEEKNREELYRYISNTRRAMVERERVRMERMSALLAAPDAFFSALWQEQEAAFASLRASFDCGYEAAAAAARWREELECLREEVQHRQQLVQEEMSSRSGIEKQSDEHLRCTFAALLSQWTTRMVELEISEDRERERLVSSEGMAYSQMSALSAEHLGAAKKREAARLRQELLQRQVALQEDKRVCVLEEELLPFSDARASSGTTEGKHQPQQPEPPNEAYVFKTKLILSQLGVTGADEGNESTSAACSLTAEAVDTLTLLLDVMNAKRSSQLQELKHVEKAYDNGAKKVASLEETLQRETEKKEEAALCLQRDTEDRQRRLENDLNEKRRGVKQIEIEQRRKEEAESELQTQKDEIESIKQCIHKRH